MAVDDVYTKSLLHFDGPYASQSVVDESGKIWTVTGGGSNTYAPVTPRGLLFTAGSFSLDTPVHADFNVGSGDFTIEISFVAGTLGSPRVLCGQADAAGSASSISWFLQVTSTNAIQGGVYSGSTGYALTSSASVIGAATWYHAALVRWGNIFMLFLNGVMVSASSLAGVTVNSSAGKPTLGRLGQYDANKWIGNLDHFRFSKGIARYTANYTPSSQAFVPDAYSSAIIEFDTEGNLAVDSTGSRTWTVNGTPVHRFVKFGTGCYLFYDTAVSIVNTPAHADFAMGSGNFTVDFWVSHVGISASHIYFGQRQNSTTAGAQLAWITGANVNWYVGDNTSWLVQLSWTHGGIAAETWMHFAFVRNGNVWTIYQNGIARASTTVSMTVGTNPYPFHIGAENTATNGFFGFMDEFRVSKGIARWTSNFTPPTKAYVGSGGFFNFM